MFICVALDGRQTKRAFSLFLSVRVTADLLLTNSVIQKCTFSDAACLKCSSLVLEICI